MLFPLLVAVISCRSRSGHKSSHASNDIFLKDDSEGRRYKRVKTSRGTPMLPKNEDLSVKKLGKSVHKSVYKKFLDKEMKKKVRDFQQISILERFGIPQTVLFGTRKNTRALGKFMAFLNKMKKDGIEKSPETLMGLFEDRF